MNANFYSYYNVIFWDSNTLYSKLHVASTIWITWVIRDVIDQNSVINCLFARQNFQKMRRYSYCIDVMKYYVLWVLIILIWWKCPQHIYICDGRAWSVCTWSSIIRTISRCNRARLSRLSWVIIGHDYKLVTNPLSTIYGTTSWSTRRYLSSFPFQPQASFSLHVREVKSREIPARFCSRRRSSAALACNDF